MFLLLLLFVVVVYICFLFVVVAGVQGLASVSGSVCDGNSRSSHLGAGHHCPSHQDVATPHP